MSKRLIHMRDIRLFNNAGISLPVCKADDEYLDTEFNGIVVNDIHEVTCDKCKKIWDEKFPLDKSR